MALWTSKAEASESAALPPAELVAHAEQLLAEAEGGIKMTRGDSIPTLKANLAGAYAQLALAKLALGTTEQQP